MENHGERLTVPSLPGYPGRLMAAGSCHHYPALSMSLWVPGLHRSCRQREDVSPMHSADHAFCDRHRPGNWKGTNAHNTESHPASRTKALPHHHQGTLFGHCPASSAHLNPCPSSIRDSFCSSKLPSPLQPHGLHICCILH